MFIDLHWPEGVLALLVAINGATGSAPLQRPIRTLTEADVLVLSAALADGRYRPADWFVVGEAVSDAALDRPGPPVGEQVGITVVSLGIEPSGRERVSSRSGGLLFEDPFYAVLAGYNLGVNPSRPVDLRVSSREQAWSQRRQIVAEVRQRTYVPERYFFAGGAPVGADGLGAFRLLVLPAEGLAALVREGTADVTPQGATMLPYSLYHYVAP